jgi:hypothetical protein
MGGGRLGFGVCLQEFGKEEMRRGVAGKGGENEGGGCTSGGLGEKGRLGLGRLVGRNTNRGPTCPRDSSRPRRKCPTKQILLPYW